MASLCFSVTDRVPLFQTGGDRFMRSVSEFLHFRSYPSGEWILIKVKSMRR